MDPLTQAVLEQQLLLQAIRKYAREHYEKGWDVLVECWEDTDIQEHIGNARTLDGALKKLRPIFKLHKERYDEVLSEVF